MLNHGEFKSVRTTADNLESPDEGKQHNDGADQCAGSGQSEAATRRATSLAAASRAIPKAVTLYELAEERLGEDMLREALECHRTPNPASAAVTAEMAKEIREQNTARRRAEVKRHAEEKRLTLYEVASTLGVAVSTIRTDIKVLRVRLMYATSPQHDRARLRRTKLGDLSQMGIPRAEAARRLGVSEATVRRDLQIAGIEWGES
tara:strand:+ start:10467 stop:11081 length:615 start_codon:yes stop_codon:yes gene_type:complete